MRAPLDRPLDRRGSTDTRLLRAEASRPTGIDVRQFRAPLLTQTTASMERCTHPRNA